MNPTGDCFKKEKHVFVENRAPTQVLNCACDLALGGAGVWAVEATGWERGAFQLGNLGQAVASAGCWI